jgi:hypothetical protein
VIDRRAFIGTLAGGFLAAPLAAEAQPAGKVYRVGILVVANRRVYNAPVMISAARSPWPPRSTPGPSSS